MKDIRKILLTVGIPGSGKSTWARELMAREPGRWKRINNDAIREALDFSVYSPENEKLIKNVRWQLLNTFLQKNWNVVIDNVNAGSRHFEEVCQIVRNANITVVVEEVPFYLPLEEALARNAKREGIARVPDEVVKKFWGKLGGKQFQFYHPKQEFFEKREVKPLVQDERQIRGIIVDLDGTLAVIGNRSPYDASQCDELDAPNHHVIEAVKLYYQAGYRIIFCSGRMERDRAPTVRFIEKHLPRTEYQLFMRPTDDQRKDAVVKKEIYETHIKGRYFVAAVIDDRLSVCRLWFHLGLPLMRVGDPDANF